MSQTAPTASGTLASTPFAHLLVYALDRHLTGSLVLEQATREKHAVQLLRGAPTAARTATPVAPLGELTIERGLLTSERLGPAIELARHGGRRLGEVLLEWGAVTPEQLGELLEEQVARRVESLAMLPGDTRYGYYDGATFLANAGGPEAPCSPLALAWRALKCSPPADRIAEMLAKLGSTPLHFQADAPLSGFDFDADERAFVEVLAAKPQALAELVARDLVDSGRAEQLVYLFVALRYFDIGSGARPVGAEQRPSALPDARTTGARPFAADPRATGGRSAAVLAPGGASADPPQALEPAAPVDNDFRRDLRARAEATQASYYDLLGVPPEAAPPSIAAAYFQLAKRWHPDRLGPEYADVRELATKIFARMSEAHQVLADPERRRQYDELLSHGEGAAEEQEEVQKIVRAATNFQKAQVLLKRNNLAGAEEAARAALTDAPDQADHIAMVAWLESNKPNADVEHLLKELDRAARLEQANLRVRWFRGQLLKRLGRARRALEDFRYIVDQDPRNVDAQREIRLYDMQRTGGRAKSDPPVGRSSEPGRPKQDSTSEKGGLLGRLFKR